MNGFKISVMTMFYPVDAFTTIKKQRERFSYLAPTLILLWSLFSNVAQLFIVHYPLSGQDVLDVNMFQQIASFLLPFALWVIAHYYVTCIFSGEVMLREVYASTCYALLPYAIFTLPVAAFTNVMGINSAGLINSITVIISIWVCVLVLISVREMNNYSFPHTFLVIFISLLAVLFVAVIFVLLYVLGVKLYDFLSELFKEYKLILFD